MTDLDLLEEFLTEATELLANVEDDMLALEKHGADVDPETINHLFRALHTIKGAASFLDLPKVTKLSHGLENIIGLVRSKELMPGELMAGCLFRGIDKLGVLLANLDDDSLEINEELQALEDVISAEAVSETNSSNTEEENSQEASCGGASDFADFDIQAAKAKNQYVHEFTIDLVAECTGKNRSPAALIQELCSVGELLNSTSDLAAIEAPSPDKDGRHVCSFLLATIIDDPEMLALGSDVAFLSSLIHDPCKLPKKEAAASGADPKKKKAEKSSSKTAQAASSTKKAAVLSPTQAAKPPAPEGDLSASQSKTAKDKLASDETVRISVGLLDRLMDLAGELVLVRNQNMQAMAGENLEQLAAVNQRLNVITSDLQAGILQTRMRPVGTTFTKFNRIVRDLAKTLGKRVELEIIGSDVELDKKIIEAIGGPLTHLVRNSVDHGIESPEMREQCGKSPTGHVRLSAFHEAGQVNIQIEDDGKGLDSEAIRKAAVSKKLITLDQARNISERETLDFIFAPGFSTAAEVTDISGRGVGMDVVKTSFQKLGGSVEIASQVGKGTTITVKLPLTLAIVPVLIVAVEDCQFAIPQANIDEVVWLYGDDVYQAIKKVEKQEVYWLRGKLLPILRLSTILEMDKSYLEIPGGERRPDRRAQIPDRRLDSAEPGMDGLRSGLLDRRISFVNSLYIVVLKFGKEQFGLLVDTIIDTEEIVVKSLHKQLKSCGAFAGTTVLGDGKIAMIVDIAALATLGKLRFIRDTFDTTARANSEDSQQTVLLFDINGEEQFALPLCLITRVERIWASDIQIANQREYLNFRDELIPLIRLDNAIPTVKGTYSDQLYVIIPKCQRPIGIVAGNVLDTVDVECQLDGTTIKQPGFVGSKLLDGRLTLFLDAFAVIEKIEPNWLVGQDEKACLMKRALVLEDSSFYQMLICSYLRGNGAEVKSASNGRDGLAELEKERVDVVICDIEMPTMDGFEFARRVRSQEQYRDLPMLAISGLAEEETRDRALDAGFNEFWSKFDREGMLSTLKALLAGGVVA